MSLARTMEGLMAGNSVIRKMFEMGQEIMKKIRSMISAWEIPLRRYPMR